MMSDNKPPFGLTLSDDVLETMKFIGSMKLSPELRESLLKTQDMINRVRPMLEIEPVKFDLPPNPIVRTNAILEKLSEDIRRVVANTEQQAEIFKSLANTANLSLAEAASSSAEAKQATLLTKRGVIIAIIAIVISTSISIWGIVDARNNGNSSDKKLEELVVAVHDLSKSEEMNRATTIEYIKALTEVQRQRDANGHNKIVLPQQRLKKQ